MKAIGAILPTVQQPQTIFGVPPKLGALTFAVSLIVGVMVMKFITMGGGLLVFIAALGVSASYVWRQRRRDVHCETLMFLARVGKSPVRCLIGGQPPEAHKRKGGSKSKGAAQ